MKALTLSFLTVLFASPVMAMDNACEAVILSPLSEGSDVASYRSAETVLTSIYDDATEVVLTIDGDPVRAIMCTRDDVIPTLRDFPILKAGLPLSLSTNFDASDSAFLTILYQDGKFEHIYKGPDLFDDQKAALKDVMEIFNLQPHDLDKKPHDKKKDK